MSHWDHDRITISNVLMHCSIFCCLLLIMCLGSRRAAGRDGMVYGRCCAFLWVLVIIYISGGYMLIWELSRKRVVWGRYYIKMEG